MIKIGIECENLEDPKSRWGIGKITLNLLKEYAKNLEWQKKYKLFLYFKNRVPDDEVLQNPIFTKRVLGFPSFNIFYHILMPLRAMIDRVNWMFFPAYQLPPLYLGKSIVVLTQDVYYEYKQGSLPFRYKLSYRIFTNWAARFATKIMTISETSKKEVAKLYKINPDRIFVNYLGIEELSFFARDFEGQRKEDNYILFVGQMFPRRHARETILAFDKLALEFLDLKLVLVGPDKYSEPTIGPLIKEINEKLSRDAVIHKEQISNEELKKLYAGAKALVYVSDREAFGLPPMEALSFGIPPVIADNELGHELFGEYAFYAKSGEVDDIADAIRRALNDENSSAELRARITNSGPEFVKKYNWKNFTNRWLKIINDNK